MGDHTWDEIWSGIDGEAWLAAKALLELSPTLQRDAMQWMQAPPELDWDGWIGDVDTAGRGWSSTEHRLFDVVAALTATEPRAVSLRGVLDAMGSWESEVWRVLVEWGTGGNNRDVPGRVTVLPNLR